ncbi:MAG: Uncharacterised protein [Alphaproteobacteria bacterium]|nr:MAG: Uncharacterised protein [Alphaproteobacteria bacterium]
MKLKKRLTQNIGIDPGVAALMATGMAGLVAVTQDDAPPQKPEEQAETRARQDAPTLNETPFADPVLPPPPAHAPGQREVFIEQETAPLPIAELLPPVEAAPPIGWQATPQHMVEPLAENPPPPEPRVAEETPPPPPQEEDEEMTDEDNDEMMMSMADDAPTASGNIDLPRGQASPGNMDFEPPTPQEEALWDCLFHDVNVPQNEVAPPFEVPLNRDITEARLLLEISFGDPVLDAGGFALRAPDWVPLEEELVRIENGNEIWLVANVDLNDHSYLSNLPVSIISLADPTLFRILDIYVGPPGDTSFEDTYFTADASEDGESYGEEDYGEEGDENSAVDIEIPLNRQITTSRKLTEINFDDAALDAGGISIDVRGALEYGEQLFGVENGNEIWLRPDIDLNELPFLSYIEINATANHDPEVSQTVIIQIGPPGDDAFEDNYFTEDETGDEMEGSAGSPDGAPIEPCEEVIEDYIASEPMEDFSSSAPDIL